jgi:hypothetical protein
VKKGSTKAFDFLGCCSQLLYNWSRWIEPGLGAEFVHLSVAELHSKLLTQHRRQCFGVVEARAGCYVPTTKNAVHIRSLLLITSFSE